MATTGQLIRAARATKGLSQLRLGEFVGVSNLIVSEWERDLRLPSESDFDHLAEHLGTTPDQLKGDAKRKPGRPALPLGMAKKAYRSDINIFGPIPEWVGYEDLVSLIRQWRGRCYDERRLKVWIERGHEVFGKLPSKVDCLAIDTNTPGVRRRTYNWEKVKAWLIGTLQDPDSPVVKEVLKNRHLSGKESA